MKTIVETTTNLSKYLLNDDITIVLNTDRIIVGEPPLFIVADLNNINAVIYENIIAPADWSGNKYMFDGINWVLNSNWIERVTPT